MMYVSTRGQAPPAPFRAVLLEGLAADGGLMAPRSYPQVDRAMLQRWGSLAYPQLACEVMRLYADDYPQGELARMTQNVYTTRQFGDEAVTPLTNLEPGLKLLHLAGGPTLAFKDLAMQ